MRALLPARFRVARWLMRIETRRSLGHGAFPTLHEAGPFAAVEVASVFGSDVGSESVRLCSTKASESLSLVIQQMLGTYLVERNLHALTTSGARSQMTAPDMLEELPEELLAVLVSELRPHVSATSPLPTMEAFIQALDDHTRERLVDGFQTNAYFNDFENLIEKRAELKHRLFHRGFDRSSDEPTLLRELDAVLHAYRPETPPRGLLLECAQVLLRTTVRPTVDVVVHLAVEFQRLGLENYTNMMYHLLPFLHGMPATPLRLRFRMAHAQTRRWRRDFLSELRFLNVPGPVHNLDNHYHFNNPFTTHMSLHPLSLLTLFQRLNHTMVEVTGFAQAVQKTAVKEGTGVQEGSEGPGVEEGREGPGMGDKNFGSKDITEPAVIKESQGSPRRELYLSLSHINDCWIQPRLFDTISSNGTGSVTLSPTAQALLFATNPSLMACPLATYKGALEGAVALGQFEVFDALTLKMVNNTLLDARGCPYVVIGPRQDNQAAVAFNRARSAETAFAVPHSLKLINNLGNINVLNDAYADNHAVMGGAQGSEAPAGVSLHTLFDKQMLGIFLDAAKASRDLTRLRWLSPILKAYVAKHSHLYDKAEMVRELEFVMETRIKGYVSETVGAFSAQTPEAQRENPLRIALTHGHFAHAGLGPPKAIDALFVFRILTTYLQFGHAVASDVRDLNKVLDFEATMYGLFEQVEAETARLQAAL